MRRVGEITKMLPIPKMNLLTDYLAASLSTVKEDVGGVKTIVAPVCRGSEVSQRQEGWEDVHPAAAGGQWTSI